MASEADSPEAIFIMKTEQGCLSKQTGRTADEFSPMGLEKFKGGSNQPLETVEHSTEIESSGAHYDKAEAVISVVKSSIETPEGESFLKSASATTVASEETRRAPEHYQALGIPNLVDHDTPKDEEIVETVEEKGYKGNQDMDEAGEKMEKENIDHDTLDVKESQSLKVAGEEILGMSTETAKGDGKEALLHASDLTVEKLNEEAEMVAEKSSDSVGEEKDPESNTAREKTEDEKHEKESAACDIIEDKSISTIAASSSIQDSNDEISEIGENGKDKLNGPSVSLATGLVSNQEAGLKEGHLIEEAAIVVCDKESQDTGVTSEQMNELAEVHRQMQPDDDVGVSSVTETEEIQIEENPEILSQVSQTQPEDIKQSPKEEQNESFARESGTDDEKPEAKFVSSFLKCEEVKQDNETDQSLSENVDSFTLNKAEKTIKTFEKSTEEDYKEDKPTQINDITETSIEKIEADEENETAEVELSNRNVGDIHVPHSLVDETKVQGENPEIVSKLEPEEQVPELITSKEEDRHTVNELESNQSTENTKPEQTSTESAEKNMEETKEEAKVDSLFSLHEEHMQSKDKDLPMEEVSEITNGMNIDSSEIIEIAEHDNMENMKHGFGQQSEQVVEKQQIPLDLVAEENETSSRENVNIMEEELNKSLRHKLEGKDEEDKPTDTNEMKIDTDEKNQTAEVEYSKNNVGDIDVPPLLVDETIHAERENLDTISNSEPGEQVHEGKGTYVEEDKHIGNKCEANLSTENKESEQTSTEEITMELNTRRCENMETLDSIVNNLDVKDAEKNIEETKEEAKPDSSFMLSEESMHGQDKDLAMEDVSEIITQKNVDNSKTIEVAEHNSIEDLVQQNETVKEKLEKSLETESDQENKITASNENIDICTFTEEEQSVRTLEVSMEATDEPTDTNGITEKEISIEQTDAPEENHTTDVEASNKSVSDIHIPHSFADETPQVEGENPENVSKLDPEEQVHELNRTSKEEDMHIANKRAEDTNLEQTFTEGMTAMQLNAITCENTETLSSKGSLDVTVAEKNIKETKEEDCSTERTQINTKGDEDENSPALPLRAECTIDEKAGLNSTAEVEETERESIGEGKTSKWEEDVENNNKNAQVHPKITDKGEFTKEQIIEGDVACLSPEPIEEGRTKSQGNENEKEEDANEQTISESFVKDRSLDLVQDGQINDFQDNKKEAEKALEEEQETMVEVEAIQNEASQNNKNIERTSDTTLVKQEESLQGKSVNLAQMQATVKDESNEEKYSVASLEKQEESMLAAKMNVDPMETEIETQIDEGKSDIMVAGEDNNNGLAEATETVKTGGAKDNMEEVNAVHGELITDGNDGDNSRDVILEDSVCLQDDEMGTEKSKEEEPETGAGEIISRFTSQDNQSPRSHALWKQEKSSQVHDVNMNPTEAITENKSQGEKSPVEDRDNDVPEVKETINSENETEKEGNYEVRSTDFVGEPLVDVPHTEKEAEKSKQETFQESESEIVEAAITDKPSQDDQGPEKIFDTTLVEAEESLRVANMHMTPTEDTREEKYYVVTSQKHEDALVDAKEESEKNIPRMVEYMEQNVQEDDRVEKLEGLSNVTSEEIKENTSSKSEEKITSKEEETIQNPVEASEETMEWEETKNLEVATENKTAKEEDIKAVPEVLKDSKSTEGKNSELDSSNMLETTSAGNETREQDHDGVRSLESTETETTPDKCQDENLQSTKLDEKLECTSELVAEDESNAKPEMNLAQSDENSDTAQEHNWKFFEEQIIRQQFTEDERETEEDIEPKSENRDHFDNVENQKEDTHATVSTDEVQNGEEKDDESENFKVNVMDKEKKKEGHVVSLDVETVDKVEAFGPVSTQYLKRQDSEQKEAENSETEIVTLADPGTKEVNTNQGVPDACSKHEVQGIRESLEREPEEKLDADADKGETIVARQILEPRLENSLLDDRPAEAFTNTPDEKVLETTEPGLHGDEVDSVQLEETIPDLASQLSAFDHEEAKKDCIIIEDSEANEVNKNQEDSDTRMKCEDNTLKETDPDETGTNAKTEIPEQIWGEVQVGGEPIEVFVSTSDEKDLETSETSLHGDEIDSVKVGKTSTDLVSQLTNSDTEKEEKQSVTMEDPETSEESYVKETDDKLTVEKLDAIEADATVKTETPEVLFRKLQLDDKPVEDFLVTSDERPLVTTESSPNGDEADSMKLEEDSYLVASQPSTCDHDKTVEESITVEDPEPDEVTRSQAFSDVALMPEDCDVKQPEDTEAEKNQNAEKLDADEGDKTVRTVAPIEDEKHDNALVEAKEESGENIPIIVESTVQNLQEDDRVEKLQGLPKITSEETEENASLKTVEKLTSTEEETLQNPVEACGETTKWEETNILDDFTENESAKEEDVKTVPGVLKDSKILELDSQNMLETTNAGKETSEQKVLDGMKVCSPDLAETETTSDDCEEDKNLQSTKLDETLECTSELVAEDESNVIAETNQGQSDENSNTAQDHNWKFFEEQIIRQQFTEDERETEEDIEPKSENRDHTDNIENQKEDTHAIVFTDEVQNEQEKDDESENFKENVTDEENKKEGHVVFLDVETVDKMEVSSPSSTQYLKRQDSEQKEAENSEKEITTLEDPETKEVNTNQEVPDECSKNEVQSVRESLEREPEEKLKVYADKAETIVARQILEPRLEDSQLADKPPEAFTNTPDEKVLKTTEPGLHGDEVDCVELEETSRDLASQLSAFDHDEAKTECIIIEDSEANEADKSQEDSDTRIKCKDNILKETDPDETGTNAKTEIPEQIWGEVQVGGEPIEVVVSTSDEKDLETSETGLHGDEVDSMEVGKTSTDLVSQLTNLDTEKEEKQSITMEDPETSEESYVKETDDKLAVEKFDAIEADATVKTETTEVLFRELQLDDKPVEGFLVTSDERPLVTTEPSPNGDEADSMKLEEASSLVVSQLSTCDHDKTEGKSITMVDPEPNEVNGRQAFSDAALVPEDCDVKQAGETEAEKNQTAEELDADEDDKTVRTGATETSVGEEPPSEKQADDFITTSNERSLETIEVSEARVHSDEVDSMNPEETSFNSVSEPSVIYNENVKQGSLNVDKDLETRETSLHADEVDNMKVVKPSTDLESPTNFDTEKEDKRGVTMEDPKTSGESHVKEINDEMTVEKLEAVEAGATVISKTPEMRFRESQLDDKPIEDFHATSNERPLVITETTESSPDGDEVDSMKLEEASSHVVSQLSTSAHDKTEEESITVEDPEPTEVNGSQAFSDAALMPEDCDVKQAGETEAEKNQTPEKLDADEGDKTVRTGATETSVGEEQPDDLITTSNERSLETIEITEARVHSDEVDSMNPEETSFDSMAQLSTCDHDKTEEESITVEDPEPNEVNGSQAFSDAALMPEDCDVKQAGETEAEKNQTAEKLTEARVHSDKVNSMNPEETSFDSVSEPPVIDNEIVEVIDGDEVEESKMSLGVAFQSNNQTDEGKDESGKSIAAEKVYVNESSETGSAVAAETTSGEAHEEPVEALGIFSNERSLETIVTTEARLPGKGDSLKAERVTAEVPGANEVQETHTFSDVVSVSKDEATTEETSIMEAQLDDKPVKLFTSNQKKSSPEATEISEASLQGKRIDSIEVEESTSDWVFILQNTDQGNKEKGSVAVDEDKVEESKLSSDAVFESNNQDGQIDETGKGLAAENLDVDQTSETVTDTKASLEDAQLDDKVQNPLPTANDESSLGITGTAEASLQGEGGDRIKLEETTSNSVSQLPTFGSENAEKENITEGTCDADKVEETKISSDAVNELKDHDGEETGKSLIMEKPNPDATSATATDITKVTGLEEAGQSLLDNKHVNAIISSPDERSPETIEALQKEIETMQLQDDSSNLSTNAEEDNLGSDAVLESEVSLKGIEGTGKILAVDKIDDETASGQIPTAEELEERLKIPTFEFPIDEQEHKGTTTVKKLEEENKKEVETLEDHSTTMAPEESCLQMEEDEKLKAASQETKLNKDLQKNSLSVVCEGEGQPRDGALQLERQKDEDEVTYVSSPSESEQIVKLTRLSKEASISKFEASEEESFESVKICEVTKTDLTEEGHKTLEGNPTTNNEVLSEKVSDKEVAKGQQELNAEEVPGNKIEKVPQTITNDTQNEELIEESNSHHTHEQIEKGMENENKIAVDSGMISMKEETERERFPDEPERMDGVGAEIRSNLEDQNGQTNSGNNKEGATLICQESGTENPQGTMVDREANNIPPNIDQKEQSSLLRAQRQIPEETLDETTEAMISSMKEDVPPKMNAATPEVGNVTEVNSEVAGIEHGGHEMIDLSEKTTEGSTLIDRSKISLSDLLHRSKKEGLQDAGHSTEQEESTASQEGMKSQVTETIPVEGPKSDEEDGEEQEKTDPDSVAPVIVEASRDIDVKAAHKKSHGILSGVGSKVKHSISKVKKVITGKSSHPKTLSPK